MKIPKVNHNKLPIHKLGHFLENDTQTLMGSTLMPKWLVPLDMVGPNWGFCGTPQYHNAVMFGGFQGILQLGYLGAARKSVE